MYCGSCGKTLREQAQFCTGCGAPAPDRSILVRADIPVAEAAVSVPAPRAQPTGFDERTGLCPICQAPTVFRRRAGNPWFCTVCGTHADPAPVHKAAPVEEMLYCGNCTRHT